MRAEIDTQLGTELVGWAMAHEMDCADFRTATEESTLRAFDNLDALKVEQLDNGRTAARDGDLVLEDRYARLGVGCAIVGSDTADDVARVVGTLDLDLETGNEIGHIVNLLSTEEGDILSGHRTYGDRDIDGGLLAFLSGDDDLAEHLGIVIERHGDILLGRHLGIGKTDAGEDQSRARRDGRHDETSVDIGGDALGCAFDNHSGARKRLARGGDYASGDTDVLRQQGYGG